MKPTKRTKRRSEKTTFSDPSSQIGGEIGAGLGLDRVGDAPKKPSRSLPLTPRGRLSRDKLLTAAARVFGEYGYYQASVSEITRVAGTAQGTFYVHFESKYAIFEELVLSTNELIRSESRKSVQLTSSVLAAEEAQFRALFNLIIGHPEIYRVIFEAEFVNKELAQTHYLKIAKGWAARLAPALADQPTSAEVEALVFCLFGVASYVGMRWPYWTKKPIPDDVFDVVMKFVRAGLMPFLREKN
jgi:AcrR family transcriptional regulator